MADLTAAQLQQFTSNLGKLLSDLEHGLEKAMQNLGGGINTATSTFSRSTRTFSEETKLSREESIRARKASTDQLIALRELSKIMKMHPDDFAKHMNVFGHMLQDQTERVIGSLKIGWMNNQVDEYVSRARKELGLETISLTTIIEDLAQPIPDLIKKLKQQRDALLATNGPLDDFQDHLKELGLEFDDLERSEKDLVKILGERQRALVRVNEAMESEIKARKAVTAGIVGFAQALYSSSITAMKYGTTVDKTTELLLGATSEEYAALQVLSKQARIVAGVSLDQFNEQLMTSALELGAYTGSRVDAAKVLSNTINMIGNLGVSARDMDAFTKQQIGTYKNLHDTVNMTSEQFNEMNEQLFNNSSIQAQMAKLEKGRRILYFQETQAMLASLRIRGLEQQEAMNVVDALASISSMKPVERMQVAFKTAQAAAMFGMDTAAAEEMRRLITFGAHGEGEQQRLLELTNELNERAKGMIQEARGQGEQGQNRAFILEQLYSQVSEPIQSVVKGLDTALIKQAGKELTPEQVGRAQAESTSLQIAMDPLKQTVADAALTTQGILRSDISKPLWIIAGAVGSMGLGKILLGKGGGALSSASEAIAKMFGRGGPATQSIAQATAGAAATGSSTLAKIFGGVVKKIPLIGGLIEGGVEYAETGSAGRAVGKGAGVAGSIAAGAALGSLIPVPVLGTLAGAVAGWIGSEFLGDLGADIGENIENAVISKEPEKNTALEDAKQQLQSLEKKQAVLEEARAKLEAEQQKATGDDRKRFDKMIEAMNANLEMNAKLLEQQQTTLKSIESNTGSTVDTLKEGQNKQDEAQKKALEEQQTQRRLQERSMSASEKLSAGCTR